MVDTPRLVRLLDPTARPHDDEKPLAPRFPDLRGKRIGILDNTKSNADLLMKQMASLLCLHYGASDVMHRRKVHAAIGATEELLDDLAVSCDLVLIGSGDWGSCTSWSVHDAVEMENRGVPTVMVCTDEFSQLGRNEAESLGIPYLPIALVPHPLGGQKAEQILEKADKSIDQVVSIATTAVPELMERFRGKV